MALKDTRGNLLGTDSAAARDATETALWRMMSFYDPPLGDLDRAIAHDPHWSLPHAMKAGFLLSLTEPSMVPEAHGHLERAQALLPAAPTRERAHVEATQRVLDGRWHDACALWDEWLLDHPRDALALQWAHLWDFYRGDVVNLRARPARALPEWDEADPLFPHVLALHAFGLEENNLQAQAEEAGRRALALDPRSPWAIHAVAHVMEMQGRFDEGAAWLRQHQRHWAEGNGLRLPPVVAPGAVPPRGARRHRRAAPGRRASGGRRLAGHAAARRCGVRCCGGCTCWASTCASAVPRWWRGGTWPTTAPATTRSTTCTRCWRMLAADDGARAEHWVARCAARALAADDAPRSNHTMAREVGAAADARAAGVRARRGGRGGADAVRACAPRRSALAAATRSAT